MYYFPLLFTLFAFFGSASNVQPNFTIGKLQKDTVLYYVKIQDSTLQKSTARGEAIYADFCVQCHMADGAGVAGTFPPLAESDYLNKKTIESIKAVKYGLQGKIIVNGKTYQSAMPKPGLYDDEVADVVNYILNSWGNAYSEMITEDKVKKLKEE